MLPFKDTHYKEITPSARNVLVADIGGTNSNFAVCAIDKDFIELIYSLHIKSRHIEDFTTTFKEVFDHCQKELAISLQEACLGLAGVVSIDGNSSKPTNLSFTVDRTALMQASGIKHLYLINDFEAVGYGLDCIDQKDMIEIHKGLCRPYAQKAIIGAGTGLGKSILYWSEETNRYIPLPSEGGHADFAAQYPEDIALIEYIRSSQKMVGAISWEHILSGRGIQSIYSFLGATRSYDDSEYSDRITRNHLNPDEIFAYKEVSKQCDDTVELYTKYYARCAKDFSLNTLSLAGFYIAGGIAAKNIDIFSRPIFMQEFLSNQQMRHILECMPIYLIADYNISLYGTAEYLRLQKS